MSGGFSLRLSVLILLLTVACPVSLSHADEDPCKMLRKFPEILKREGDQLLVSTLTHDKAKAYRDSPRSCWDGNGECTDYAVHSVDACGQVVTFVLGRWEAIDGLLLDRLSGEELRAIDLPYVSPDATLWAVVDENRMGGSTMLDVIARKDGHFVTVATRSHESCGFWGWDTPKSFLVICGEAGDDAEVEDEVEYRETLTGDGRLIETETGKSFTRQETANQEPPKTRQSCPES